uniref:Uncharacterized protein n=1 Tax=Panagrolaimus sp. PS1159 TaxID=55785 RepID=A0AC35ETG6_9BILA
MQTNGALNLEHYVPKKRKQFGKYRFVEVDPNPTIPIFLCCPYHNGDGNVPQQTTNDIKNVHQQPPLPTNFNCNFVNSNTSHANALPKPLPPPQISNDDSFYDDNDDDMDDDIISPHEKHASALFGFPEVPEQLSRSESNDIQILDVRPSTSKPLAAAAKSPNFGIIDDDFDNDEEFLAAVDA